MLTRSRTSLLLLVCSLSLAWCVGMFGRTFWTPDEPREADIAWRMSWQPDKAVPMLAGEAFCEKPPLTYWVAAAFIDTFGPAAWAARLPNLLYAWITALAVGWLARRSAGPMAGWVAACAISTFLLSYQVAIWLATDAPLLACVSVALLGAYLGFYATHTAGRLRGYTLMHSALALGFLSKSAAAWMVPALTLITLVIWERRWRELWRWELYVGLGLQACVIALWVWSVYVGPDGPAHLKVFFWNNLVGRFTRIDAPAELQYSAGHRNSPGKYLLELPIYLWPWTLLVIAALRRAWRQRHAGLDALRAVRFAIAVLLPTLVILSLAATARNIYLAPALPGVALLVGWWGREILTVQDRWDVRALRATAVLLLLAVAAFTAGLTLIAVDAWDQMSGRPGFFLISAIGLSGAAALAVHAAGAARRAHLLQSQFGLLLAYCALLVGPASQLYPQVDRWQDLSRIGRSIERDASGRPLILFAPDETTRAFIDLYARTTVTLIGGPVDPASIGQLKDALARAPQSLVVVQLPGRETDRTFRWLANRLGGGKLDVGQNPDTGRIPLWSSEAKLHMTGRYALPNGRRYAVFEHQRLGTASHDATATAAPAAAHGS